MKNHIVLMIAAFALAACFLQIQARAQGTFDKFHPDDTLYAPLLIYTNGYGSITPYAAGQLLVVGQTYTMTAIPAEGWIFSGWQQANVFAFTDITVDASGLNYLTNTSTTVSLVPGISSTQTQSDFTMPAITVLIDDPGVRTATQEQGWQADFAPVPEPKNLPLLMVGLLTFLTFDRKRMFGHSGKTCSKP